MIPNRRAVFVINSLGGGGAERVMSKIVDDISKGDEALDVSLITLDALDDQYRLASTVRRIKLDSKGSLLRGIYLIFLFFSRDRPDVIVSFLTRSNLVVVIVGKILRIRTVISERVNTTSHFRSKTSGRLSQFLLKFVYPFADQIVCVSHGVRNDLIYNYGISEDKLCVVYNPVDTLDIIARSRDESGILLPRDYFVAVGRLTENKNMNSLICAYAKADVTPDLVILGEGEQRNQLEELVQRLGLVGRVHLPGFVSNPAAVVANARAYLSASLAEGFPNALVEAMALSKPVVSSDCDSGPSEILSGGDDLKVTECTEMRYGLLTPSGDVAELARAIRLMTSDERCARYGKLAAVRAQQFSVNASVSGYVATMFPK